MSKELDNVKDAFYKLAVRERDYERTLCDRYKKQLGRLENIIKEALTANPIEDCYYMLKQDYKTYQQEFYKENKE